MKAFAIDGYKTELKLTDMPDPVAGPHDVTVEVRAAGVNPLDGKIRNGDFKTFLKYRMPLVLGNDLAGVVLGVGSNVKRFRAGDEVYGKVGTARIGTFAERIAVLETDLALKPKNTTMVEAASLPLVALTAWQVLVDKAGLKPGQKVLIHAGSGGVGTVAIQLAKYLGATVATTAGAANLELMRSLGADIALDYRKDDFDQQLEDYDVVLTSLSPDVLERSLKVLRRGGKLISLSGPPDPAFARQIGASWLVRQILRAMSFRIRKAARKHGVTYSFHFMHPDGERLGKIAEIIEAGHIRPVVNSVIPFERTPDALALVDSKAGAGKIVIDAEAK